MGFSFHFFLIHSLSQFKITKYLLLISIQMLFLYTQMKLPWSYKFNHSYKLASRWGPDACGSIFRIIFRILAISVYPFLCCTKIRRAIAWRCAIWRNYLVYGKRTYGNPNIKDLLTDSTDLLWTGPAHVMYFIRVFDMERTVFPVKRKVCCVFARPKIFFNHLGPDRLSTSIVLYHLLLLGLYTS